MFENLKRHKKGLIGTIAFHGILIILFLTMGFHTPLPLPQEKGILINFGTVEEAGGTAELEKTPEKEEQQNIPEQTTQSQPQETSDQEAENIITQDQEEAPAVKDKQEEKQTQPEKTEPQTQPEEEPEKPAEETKEEQKPERKVNEKALYPGKSTKESGESEGETKGEGNQGNEAGSPLSDNYSNKGSKGMGGIDYSLSGRNPESLPKPDYNYQIEGKVVVEITVDKYGNVTKAVPGVKGSTTLNDNLLNAAKKAALNAKFDRKPDAPAYQKGTITYYFKLQ